MELPTSLSAIRESVLALCGDDTTKRITDLALSMAYTQGRMDQVHATNMAIAGIVTEEQHSVGFPSPQP